MGRKKVKHELISNESVRKVTFRKRKAGVLKKLRELTTLCGVPACAFIFSTYDAQPDIWPSSLEALDVLEQFKNLSPKKQGKYMLNQKVFLRRSIFKLEEKLEKQRKKNQELEIELTLAGSLPSESESYMNDAERLGEMVRVLDEKIKSVTDKIEAKKASDI
ncbi:hypothetical protein SLEP1_g20665 [Rubroshorea leprosula]|uniref:MADS-box domain-containing protein n=2 Tax=Rubroshorea leprosula TaxID=152421 RepID=A0AAV5JE39_9ROSI|nr:hypothetical protein SLEP1_g20665 [Rubroshorea leprosula]